MSNETAYAQSAAPGQPDSASGASRVARAASVSNQLPPEPPTPCFRCVQEIYLSFFFDGFGQSLDDLDHLSNIGRLYNAHAKSSDELGIYATYYEGMGHVAATELRFYKNLDSPRKSPDHKNLLEIVYPGSQSDVGGGFREGDDQKSAELARISARNMLDRAWAAGVPLQPLAKLRQVNPTFAREFEFRKTVNVNGKNLTVNDLFAAYTAMLPKSSGPLETHFLEHQKLFVSWARYVHDRTAHESTGNSLFINTVDADVYNAVFPHGGGLPNYEGRDWYYKSQDPNSKVPQFTFGERRTVDDISDKTVRALATAWVHPPKLSPEVIAFFDNFVHNTITRLNNVALGDGVFMTLREIEEKGWMARQTDAAKDYVKKVLGNVSKNIKDAQDEYVRQVTSGQIPHGASIGDLSGD